MNILVTGGAGFIGSHLIEKLLLRGDFVICVDNYDDLYNSSFKKENITKLSKNKNFVFYFNNILDIDSLKIIFNKYKIETIVHLAARAGVRKSIEDPKTCMDINITGTLNILNLSRDFKVKNIIFASSSSVYGNCKKIPFSEEININEPISPYAISKITGELLCYTYNFLYKMNITCLRFFTVYGPRQRPDMAIHKFVKLIDNKCPITMFGDGSSSRDYTYISDLVNAIIRSIDTCFNYEIINIGYGNPVRLDILIKIIEKKLGKKAIIIKKDIQKGDVNLTYADIKKAKKLLNYSPIISIEEGIEKFVNWYKKYKKKY